MKMKNIILVLFIVCMLFILFGCSGDKTDDEPKGNPAPAGVETEPAELFTYEYVADYDGICLTYYVGSKLKVKIPDEIEGIPVVGIGASCFEQGKVVEVYFSDQLKYFLWGGNIDKNIQGAVQIPYGVTEIVKDAFRECGYITSVIIPDSVEIIGGTAFFSCRSLTSLTIGSKVQIIGDLAFGSTSVTSIIIPDGVITVGDRAFSNCRSLESVIIGNGVETIGKDAFNSCTSLSSVTIGNNVKIIGEAAFSYDKDYARGNLLATIIIPDSVEVIGNSAFEGCSLLENVIIGNGVTAIGNSAFSYCSSLSNLTIGNNVETIGKSAFRECISLLTVTIPDSVTTVGEWSFYGCESLTDITISDNIKSLGFYSFFDCPLSNEIKIRMYQICSNLDVSLNSVITIDAAEEANIKLMVLLGSDPADETPTAEPENNDDTPRSYSESEWKAYLKTFLMKFPSVFDNSWYDDYWENEKYPIDAINEFVPTRFVFIDIDNDGVPEVSVLFGIPDTGTYYFITYKLYGDGYEKISDLISPYNTYTNPQNKLVVINQYYDELYSIHFAEIKNKQIILSDYVDSTGSSTYDGQKYSDLDVWIDEAVENFLYQAEKLSLIPEIDLSDMVSEAGTALK